MSSCNLIDIEASGLDLKSYPIEIAVLVNRRLHSWLIRPAHSWSHWDEQAQHLHGLTRDMLMSQGEQAHTVAGALNQLMISTDGLLYSDAAYWDNDWIQTLFSTVNIPPEFHILPLEDLFTESDYRHFIHCRNNIAAQADQRHRAAADVRILQQALAVCGIPS